MDLRLDGYGRDFIMHYDASGKIVKTFGGQEGGIVHWGPHGGMADLRDAQKPTLLIAMSDQQHLLRLSTSGEKLQQTDLPGGNPRQIRLHKDRFYLAHLADNWPKDRNSRGFVSVLDADLKVISNIGGTSPEYDDTGRLRYANCGHNPPLVLRRDGSRERLTATAMVVGLVEDWEPGTAETVLGSGDLLAVYSDGLTEATDGSGEEFGEDRLARTIEAHRDRDVASVLDAVFDEIRRFSVGEQADDQTMVIARVR